MGENTSFEFSRALNKLIKNFLRALVTIDGVVTAYNADNFTCDIIIQKVAYTAVPIKVLVGSKASIYEIPVINTKCLVTFRDGNRQLPQIVSFDQVDSYYITAHTKIYIQAPETQFNDGSNGGLVLVNDLVTRMNNIENAYNDLVSKYNSHTHILTLTMGTGTAAPTTTTETTVLTETTASEIQSTVITQ